MADVKSYRVVREMEGDRYYRAGETRVMPPAEALHLVRLGALVLIAAAETVPQTKVEALPLNKGGRPAKGRG